MDALGNAIGMIDASKPAMRQTSLLAFHQLDAVKLGQRQQQVLEALEMIGPACNRQVSEYSKLPINVVTARMNELVKKAVVEEAYEGKDSVTGKTVIFWRPKDAPKEYGDSY